MQIRIRTAAHVCVLDPRPVRRQEFEDCGWLLVVVEIGLL